MATIWCNVEVVCYWCRMKEVYMMITYYQLRDRIGVRYGFGSKSVDMGLVPEEIQSEGMPAILRYAAKICGEYLKDRKARVKIRSNAIADRIRDTNYPIRSIHPEGIVLEGRIVRSHAKDSKVLVQLEAPVVSTRTISLNYPTCMASSLAGHHVWDREGHLTEYCIQDASRQLIRLYDDHMLREKYGDVVSLVEDLNDAHRP